MSFRNIPWNCLTRLYLFDSARYASGVLTQQGLQIQEFFLHNKPIEAVSDNAVITNADPLLRAVRDNPDRVIRFHPPTLFPAKKDRCLIMPSGLNVRMVWSLFMCLIRISLMHKQFQYFALTRIAISWRRTVGPHGKSWLILLRRSRLTRHWPYIARLRTRIAARGP
jgi:hypothetical protein